MFDACNTGTIPLPCYHDVVWCLRRTVGSQLPDSSIVRKLDSTTGTRVRIFSTGNRYTQNTEPPTEKWSRNYCARELQKKPQIIYSYALCINCMALNKYSDVSTVIQSGSKPVRRTVGCTEYTEHQWQQWFANLACLITNSHSRVLCTVNAGRSCYRYIQICSVAQVILIFFIRVGMYSY